MSSNSVASKSIELDKDQTLLLDPFLKNKYDGISKGEIEGLLQYIKTTKYFGDMKIFMNTMMDFIKGSSLIARKLDSLSVGKRLDVIIPGDSGFKTSQYLKQMKMCSNCNFIEFPISREGIELPEVKALLEARLPPTLDNILILDYIEQGTTIRKIIDFYDEKIKGKSLDSKYQPVIENMLTELNIVSFIKKYITANLNKPFIRDIIKAKMIDRISKAYELQFAAVKKLPSFSSDLSKLKRDIQPRLMEELGKMITEESKRVIVGEDIVNDNLRYDRLKYFPDFKNILQIEDYYDDYIVAQLADAERYDTRCQPYFNSKGMLANNDFGCRLFIYIACIFKMYTRDFLEILSSKSTASAKEGSVAAASVKEGSVGFTVEEKSSNSSSSSASRPTITKISMGRFISIIGSSGSGGLPAKSTAIQRLKEALGADWSDQIEAEAIESIGKLSGGGYYDKYMKYKKKYLALKG